MREDDDDSFQQRCLRCEASVSGTTFFCTQCGSSRPVAGSGLQKKTTANWDPTSRDYKPWRDAPLLPKALPQLPPSMTTAPKPSWKPPKRTSAPLLPVSTPLQAASSSSSSIGASEVKKSAKGKLKKKKETAAAVAAGLQEQQAAGARVRTPGVVYFKQLAFQRRGGKRVVAPDDPPPPTTKAPSPPKKKEPVGEQTLVHPLAVYEATWLTAPGYTVHISLMDRSNGGDASRFFLRVGSVLEHPNGTAEDLQVLAVLQNDVGHLLTPPLQYWIDLNVINVNEYYMGTFLQQSLRYIAERVRQPGSRAAAAEQQMLLVEAVFETGEAPPDDLLLAAEEDGRRKKEKSKGNLIAVATEQRVRQDPRRSQPDLHLDTTIAQRACRIPIGPVYDARWVMATVRLSLLYPDAEVLLHDPLPTRYDDILKCVPVRQVVLHVYPAYNETKLGPRVVCFEPQALPVLIGPVDVDAALKEGVQAVQALLLRLCRLLNFRDVGGRLRLGVTGAAILEDNGLEGREEEQEEVEEEEWLSLGAEAGAEPLLANCIAKEAWREQEREREREDEAHLDRLVRRSAAAVRLQSLWRRALARVRVSLLRRRHQAVVPIQCLARRVIARHRVRQRQQHLARQQIDLRVLEDATSWAASLVGEMICPAHRCVDCPCTTLQVRLGGTDVTLFADFSLGGGGDGVIVHCLPAAKGDDGEDLGGVCSSVEVTQEDLEQMAASLYHLAGRDERDEDNAGPPDSRACLAGLLRSPEGRGELISLCSEGLSLRGPRLLFDIDGVQLVVFHEDGDLGVGI